MTANGATKTNTWRGFILEDPEASQANARSNIFLVGTDQATTNEKKIEELCQNPRTPIIALAPIAGKIKLYYAFKNLGGTRTRQQNKIVALEGVGPSATPLLFPENGLTKLCNVRIPLIANLKAAQDAESFREISPETGARRANLNNIDS